jgi:hypothetical protein
MIMGYPSLMEVSAWCVMLQAMRTEILFAVLAVPPCNGGISSGRLTIAVIADDQMIDLVVADE